MGLPRHHVSAYPTPCVSTTELRAGQALGKVTACRCTFCALLRDSSDLQIHGETEVQRGKATPTPGH